MNKEQLKDISKWKKCLLQIFGALKVMDTCETSYRVFATPGEADGGVGEHILGVFLQRTRGTGSLQELSFFCFLFIFFFAIFFLFSQGVTEVALTTAHWQFPLQPCKMWCHLSQCGTAFWVCICQHCGRAAASRCCQLTLQPLPLLEGFVLSQISPNGSMNHVRLFPLGLLLYTATRYEKLLFSTFWLHFTGFLVLCSDFLKSLCAVSCTGYHD